MYLTYCMYINPSFFNIFSEQWDSVVARVAHFKACVVAVPAVAMTTTMVEALL